MRYANVRTTFGLLLCSVGLLTACGCGGGEDAESPSSGAVPPEAAETIPAGADSSLTAAEAPFRLTFDPVEDDPTVVEVTVTAADPEFWSQDKAAEDAPNWPSVLMLHWIADDGQGADKPDATQSVVGRYEVADNRLRFRPAFPLLAGETYRAQFDPRQVTASGSTLPKVIAEYVVPAAAMTTPTIESIYPSGNILPANHLKFYILFSEPMQRDGIFEYFRLIDLATDKPVPRPFRHVELWSADHKQLTLWFHPGRQKQGVNLNVELGPVLKPDGEYRLEVDGEWKSAAGIVMGQRFQKTFRTGQPDHRQPLPASWILSGPQAGSRDVLTCDFHEPLDWGLLHSELSVVDAEGKMVAGHVETGYGELSWAFHIKEPWQPGKYRVAVGKLLEDLAGNSVEKPFEVDLSKTDREVKKKPEFLEFEVLERQP